MSAGWEGEGREHIWPGGHREFQFATSARRKRQAELRSEPLPSNRSIMNGLLYYARGRDDERGRRAEVYDGTRDFLVRFGEGFASMRDRTLTT